ncbi:MAG: TerB family tellurite resistance protein [Brevundimonas sp.]|nr:MAG: TerB family tellurite resistance protein [Brevundimonas sp.]
MSELSLDHFVAARAGFRRRLSADRAARLGRQIKGHEFDDHGMLVDVDDPPAPPMAFHLIYSDAKNALSGRCVTLNSIKHEVTDVRLTGYCYMRSAMRMFMASRVVEATDLATGEVHEDGLAFFREHPLLRMMTADEVMSRSPEALILQECRDEIIILSFVGASDGEFDEDEQEQIVRHVMLRSDEPLHEGMIRQRVRAFVPDERAFDRALGRLCAGEGDPVSLMRSMRRVIDADGEVDPEEMAFASEVQRRLETAGRL